MFGIARGDRGPRRVGGSIQMPDTDLAGVCGLTHISWVNQSAEVSIYVCPESRGQGIAEQTMDLLKVKAFGEFNLHRLWAEIFSNNPTSIALFEKTGYVREGTLRDHTFKSGKYWDSYIYGLVDDYEAH
jgi:RimJ/RimL family protein N-acetyltransferase